MPKSRNRPKNEKKAARRARRNRRRENDRAEARTTTINPLALLEGGIAEGREPLEKAIARGLARGLGGLEPRRRIL